MLVTLWRQGNLKSNLSFTELIIHNISIRAVIKRLSNQTLHNYKVKLKLNNFTISRSGSRIAGPSGGGRRRWRPPGSASMIISWAASDLALASSLGWLLRLSPPSATPCQVSSLTPRLRMPAISRCPGPQGSHQGQCPRA